MEPEWRRLNLANWEERTALHLGPRGYDLAPHRAGRGRLDRIAASVLGDPAGLRVAHVQCHIGDDSVAIAQMGAAEVLGVDFSPAALAGARALAAECGVPCRFALADAQAIPEALPEEAGRFDLAFASWGTIAWLPDLRAWARGLGHLLRPGGALAFADCHPVAQVFDGWEAGRPGWAFPCFARQPIPFEDAVDYAAGDPIANGATITHLHPLGDILGALTAAGFRLERLEEHDRLPWPLYPGLVRADGPYWTWPDRPWLPLAVSIRATRC